MVRYIPTRMGYLIHVNKQNVLFTCNEAVTLGAPLKAIKLIIGY